MTEETPRLSIIECVRRDDGRIVSLRGRLIFAEVGAIWSDVQAQIASLERGDRIAFDMSEVEAVDGGTMALLVHMRSELAGRGVIAEFAGAGDDVQALIHLYRG